MLQRFYKRCCWNGKDYCCKLPFQTIEAKLEDIGNHSIRPKMCLNTCLISFLGKLLRAYTSSTNLIMPFLWKLYFNWSAIQSACDELDVPPKCMYIVQQKYQFKRISNQTPGILATIISSKYDENLDISWISSTHFLISKLCSLTLWNIILI